MRREHGSRARSPRLAVFDHSTGTPSGPGFGFMFTFDPNPAVPLLTLYATVLEGLGATTGTATHGVPA
jgi:hypothetical protein